MDNTSMPQGASAGGGWKSRMILFLASQTVSLFGSSLVQFAMVWYITLETSSGLMMTISTLCGFLPQVVISLFAGVWADRYNKKVLIMLSDSFIALSTLILCVAFFMGYKEMWLLFAVSAVRSIGTGIQTPAVNSLVPQLVPKDKLMRVNGINGSIQSLVMLISPAVSGALLGFVGLEITFLVDVVTALIGVGILSTLKMPERLIRQETAEEKAQDRRKCLAELRDGVRYAMGHRFIRALLVFYAIFMFLLTPAAVMPPLLIERSYGSDVWRLTANEILFSAGAVLGGIIISAWGGFKNRIYTIALSCVGFGIMTLLLGAVHQFVLYLVFIFITGVFMPMFNSPATVLLQENVEEAMMGRVFSLIQIISAISLPLGMVVFGPLGDAMRIEILMIGTGILITFMGGVMFKNRALSGYSEEKTLEKET